MLYIIVLLVIIVISIAYLKIAIKYKIIDKPNMRSSHNKPTVRGGGIIFTIANLLFFILNDYQYPYFMFGVLLVSIISFLDDIYTLSSKIRFPFQFLAIFLVLYQVGYPFSPFYLYILILFLGIGIVNMFNFMDGINGITGMYSLSVLSGLYIVNSIEHIIDSDIIIYSAISLCVFGYFNFRKQALFFAGDIGSITIGIFIFFIGFIFAIYLSTPLILLFIIVYGADAGNTLLYRKFFTDENIFDAHRHHIYQKLVDNTNLSHLQVASVYAILQFCINFIIIKAYSLSIYKQWSLFFILIIIFILLYVYLFKRFSKKSL